MLSPEEKQTYFAVLSTAAAIGVICGLLIVLLLYKSLFHNVYNFCVFGISLGLCIYNLCDIYYLYHRVDVGNYWLVAINVISPIISYYLSTILSISMLFLLAKQQVIPWRKPKVLIPTTLLIVFIISGYLAVLFTTDESKGSSKIVAYNVYSMTVKLLLALINLIIYFICEYFLQKKFNSSSEQISNDIQQGHIKSAARTYTAIKLLVRRMRYYPLLQIVSLAPFYIWSVIRGKFAGFYVGEIEPKYIGLEIFVSICTFLDSFWMLVIYLVMNPKAFETLKRILLCRSDHIENSIFNNETKSAQADGNSRESSEGNDFSEYRTYSLEVAKSKRPLSTSLHLESDLVDSSAHDLSFMSDNDLILVAESGAHNGAGREL